MGKPPPNPHPDPLFTDADTHISAIHDLDFHLLAAYPAFHFVTYLTPPGLTAVAVVVGCQTRQACREATVVLSLSRKYAVSN
jgi:hypothetical protein